MRTFLIPNLAQPMGDSPCFPISCHFNSYKVFQNYERKIQNIVGIFWEGRVRVRVREIYCINGFKGIAVYK